MVVAWSLARSSRMKCEMGQLGTFRPRFPDSIAVLLMMRRYEHLLPVHAPASSLSSGCSLKICVHSSEKQ